MSEPRKAHPPTRNLFCAITKRSKKIPLGAILGHLAVILGPPCLDQDRLRDIFLRKIAPETSQSPSGTSQTPSGPPSFASRPRFLKLPESIFVRPSPKERDGRCSPQASSICIAILRRYKSFIENVDFGIYEWCLGF